MCLKRKRLIMVLSSRHNAGGTKASNGKKSNRSHDSRLRSLGWVEVKDVASEEEVETKFSEEQKMPSYFFIRSHRFLLGLVEKDQN
jgi:hypothetical protein